jgi:UbiD family decarboxylase
MAFDSFRDFVNALDKAGELKRISQPVATELEITEIADREMKSPDDCGIEKNLIFSYLIRTDGKKWEIVQNVPLNNFSKAKIAATENELKEEKSLVADLLPQ